MVSIAREGTLSHQDHPHIFLCAHDRGVAPFREALHAASYLLRVPLQRRLHKQIVMHYHSISGVRVRRRPQEILVFTKLKKYPSIALPHPKMYC